MSDNGNEELFDVTIHSCLYDNRIIKTIRQPGSITEDAVRQKNRARGADHQGYIDSARGKVKFTPLGFESLGAFSSNSPNLLDKLASEWGLKLGFEKSFIMNYMIKRISFDIQRGIQC